MIRTLAALSLTCALVLPAAALAEPDEYRFNPTHTSIVASWFHWGLSRQHLHFTNYEGTLLLDLDNPENSQIDVTFNLIDGIWPGPNHDRFITHFNSETFFETEVFPTARFVATSFETEDGQTGTMTGDLTIRDITLPVSLDVTLNGIMEDSRNRELNRLGVSATGVLSRSAFGLGFDTPRTSDEVTISIEAELNQVSPEEGD